MIKSNKKFREPLQIEITTPKLCQDIFIIIEIHKKNSGLVVNCQHGQM